MVIPAKRSYMKSLRVYLGSHSKMGTKYCKAFLAFIGNGFPLKSWKGSSGKKVSFKSDLNAVAKLLGAAKFTLLNVSPVAFPPPIGAI